MLAKLTSKNQLTLPKAVRELLRLVAGDRVDFVVKDDGTVVLRPVTVDVRDLKGLLHRKGLKPLSVDAMNAVIRRRAAGRDDRARFSSGHGGLRQNSARRASA